MSQPLSFAVVSQLSVKVAPLSFGHTRKVGVRRWVRKLLSAKMTARERAIILLLANGLVAGEVARLRLADVRLTERTVRVIGRAGRIRVVPLLPWTVAALDAFLNTPKRRHSLNRWLFTSRATSRPLGYAGVYRVVHGVSARVFSNAETIRRSISPNSLRDFFVSEALRRRVPEHELAEITGHKYIPALRRRSSVLDKERLVKVLARASRRPWFRRSRKSEAD